MSTKTKTKAQKTAKKKSVKRGQEAAYKEIRGVAKGKATASNALGYLVSKDKGLAGRIGRETNLFLASMLGFQAKGLPTSDRFMYGSKERRIVSDRTFLDVVGASLDITLLPSTQYAAVIRNNESSTTISATRCSWLSAFVNTAPNNIASPGTQFLPFQENACVVPAGNNTIEMTQPLLVNGLYVVPRSDLVAGRYLYPLSGGSSAFSKSLSLYMGRAGQAGESFLIRCRVYDANGVALDSNASGVASIANAFEQTSANIWNMPVVPAYVALEVAFTTLQPLPILRWQWILDNADGWTISSNVSLVERNGGDMPSNVAGLAGSAAAMFMGGTCWIQNNTAALTRGGTIYVAAQAPTMLQSLLPDLGTLSAAPTTHRLYLGEGLVNVLRPFEFDGYFTAEPVGSVSSGWEFQQICLRAESPQNLAFQFDYAGGIIVTNKLLRPKTLGLGTEMAFIEFKQVVGLVLWACSNDDHFKFYSKILGAIRDSSKLGVDMAGDVTKIVSSLKKLLSTGINVS